MNGMNSEPQQAANIGGYRFMKNKRMPAKPPRKPILYWQALTKWGGHIVIDSNNSIPILRSKYGNSVIYKAVR